MKEMTPEDLKAKQILDKTRKEIFDVLDRMPLEKEDIAPYALLVLAQLIAVVLCDFEGSQRNNLLKQVHKTIDKHLKDYSALYALIPKKHNEKPT